MATVWDGWRRGRLETYRTHKASHFSTKQPPGATCPISLLLPGSPRRLAGLEPATPLRRPGLRRPSRSPGLTSFPIAGWAGGVSGDRRTSAPSPAGAERAGPRLPRRAAGPPLRPGLRCRRPAAGIREPERAGRHHAEPARGAAAGGRGRGEAGARGGRGGRGRTGGRRAAGAGRPGEGTPTGPQRPSLPPRPVLSPPLAQRSLLPVASFLIAQYSQTAPFPDPSPDSASCLFFLLSILSQFPILWCQGAPLSPNSFFPKLSKSPPPASVCLPPASFSFLVPWT